MKLTIDTNTLTITSDKPLSNKEKLQLQMFIVSPSSWDYEVVNSSETATGVQKNVVIENNKPSNITEAIRQAEIERRKKENDKKKWINTITKDLIKVIDEMETKEIKDSNPFSKINNGQRVLFDGQPYLHLTTNMKDIQDLVESFGAKELVETANTEM